MSLPGFAPRDSGSFGLGWVPDTDHVSAKPPGHTNEQLGLRAARLNARALEEGSSYEAAIPRKERRDVPSSLTNAQMSFIEEELRPQLVPALSRPRVDLQGPATAWTGCVLSPGRLKVLVRRPRSLRACLSRSLRGHPHLGSRPLSLGFYSPGSGHLPTWIRRCLGTRFSKGSHCLPHEPTTPRAAVSIRVPRHGAAAYAAPLNG